MRNGLLLGILLLGAGIVHTPAAHAQVSPPAATAGTQTAPDTTAPTRRSHRRATAAAPVTAAAPDTTAATPPTTTAQPPATTAEPAEPASTSPHHRRTLTERFAAANTTHDGKLTLDQARAGRLRAVARDFDQIDPGKRGYVTLDEIKAFQKKQRDARRAARAQSAGQTSTAPAPTASKPPASR